MEIYKKLKHLYGKWVAHRARYINFGDTTSSLAMLQVKGIGDLLIAVNHFEAIGVNIPLIVTHRNKKLLDELGSRLPKETVDFKNDSPNFYNLKKINLSIVSDIISARRVIKKYNKIGYACIIDCPYVRNMIVFYGLNVIYLPASNSIYDSYSRFLGVCISSCRSDEISNVLVFPFGSSSVKQMSCETLISLHKKLKELCFGVSFAIHSSFNDKSLPHEINVNYYDTINEFDAELGKHDALITVDSMSLHRAYGTKRSVYVMTDTDTHFVPPALLSENVFSLSDCDGVVRKIYNDSISVKSA